MGGVRQGAGIDDGKRKNGDSVNEEPFNKLRRKIAELGSQNGEKAGPLTAAQDKSPTSSDVFSPSVPLCGFSSISYSSYFGDSETLQESEKISLSFPPPKEVLSEPRTSSPSRATPRLASTGSESVHNYGPFSPSGSGASSIGQTTAKRSPTRIKFQGPKSPAPKQPDLEPVPAPTPKPKTRLLQPFRTCTYLRPKPAFRPPRGTPMGPPPPVDCLTPHRTVKKALNILKHGLDLTSFATLPSAAAVGAETNPHDPNPAPPYSLSNLTPELPWTMEQVVLELDQYVSTLPEDSSSREMESRLTDFQVRLGLAPWPSFYHMMWFGAGDFLYFLSHSFSYEDDEF